MSETTKPASVEQRRQDLMARDRELYDYIAHVISTKVLDSAGDTASGFHHGLANTLWARAGQHRRAANDARTD